MLELKHIVKNYECGGTAVRALDGIDLSFRRRKLLRCSSRHRDELFRKSIPFPASRALSHPLGGLMPAAAAKKCCHFSLCH